MQNHSLTVGGAYRNALVILGLDTLHNITFLTAYCHKEERKTKSLCEVPDSLSPIQCRITQ